MTDYRIKWVSLVFVFLTLLFETFALKLSYTEYLIYSFDNQITVFFLINSACILTSIYLYFRFVVFAFSAKWSYKIPCLLIFGFALFVEFSYQKALGRFTETFDIESAFATTTEQQIASLRMYADYFAVLPCLLFLICLIFVRPKENTINLKRFF